MCRFGTSALRALSGLALLAATLGAETRLDWRHVGTSGLDLALSSVASGPVLQAWYAGDGSRLFVRLQSGQTFATTDFEAWTPARDAAQEGPLRPAVATSAPEAGARLVAAAARAGRVYALGRYAYRTDDGGATWANLTRYREESVLGEGLLDLAVSPRNPDEIVVAAVTGVWRSLDGGDTWAGINDRLPNLPVERIVSLGGSAGAVRIQGRVGLDQEFEWAPGDRMGWRPVESVRLRQEAVTRSVISQTVGAPVATFHTQGEYAYAGTADGRLISSSNLFQNWGVYTLADGGGVAAIFVDAQEPWIALAAIRPKGNEITAPVRVLRTITAGGVWQDITGDLPAGAANGIVADHSTGAIYAATDSGVYYTFADLHSAGPPAPWVKLAGLAEARAVDVKLDAGGNQLYLGLEGYGVYAALAPHRMRDLRVVSAADLQPRAAAPGALMSVLGARVDSVHAGTRAVPVLAASAEASQIQIPFDVSGGSLPLAIQAQGRQVSIGLPLKNVSPAIFSGPDGQAMIVNADTGALLDPLAPAHSAGRLQIFSTGLGRVRPDWPAGMPGPLEHPPEVLAAVKAYLNREPLEVTRATLAPGYIGFYLVEVQLPKVVDAGQAELYLEADGQSSNHVLIYLEP